MCVCVCVCVSQPEAKPLLDILEEEYFGTTEDRNEIRSSFTKLLGDLIFTIPAILTANAHRGQRGGDSLVQQHPSTGP